MIKTLLTLFVPVLIIGQSVYFSYLSRPQVLGSSTSVDYLSGTSPITTQSSFRQKIATESATLPFAVKYLDNPNTEYGAEKIITEGVNGTKEETYQTLFWQGKEVSRKLIKTQTTPPSDEVVERGTKISWQEISFNGATFRYWRKLNVWATSYDGHCQGCLGRTWAGTGVTLGTCAVDPKVIVMGSRFYVPGYGICRAEDIGGAIKGNRVDLGFPDVKQGWWSAHHVDIYLLDGEPNTQIR